MCPLDGLAYDRQSGQFSQLIKMSVTGNRVQDRQFQQGLIGLSSSIVEAYLYQVFHRLQRREGATDLLSQGESHCKKHRPLITAMSTIYVLASFHTIIIT